MSTSAEADTESNSLAICDVEREVFVLLCKKVVLLFCAVPAGEAVSVAEKLQVSESNVPDKLSDSLNKDVRLTKVSGNVENVDENDSEKVEYEDCTGKD